MQYDALFENVSAGGTVQTTPDNTGNDNPNNANNTDPTYTAAIRAVVGKPATRYGALKLFCMRFPVESSKPASEVGIPDEIKEPVKRKEIRARLSPLSRPSRPVLSRMQIINSQLPEHEAREERCRAYVGATGLNGLRPAVHRVRKSVVRRMESAHTLAREPESGDAVGASAYYGALLALYLCSATGRNAFLRSGNAACIRAASTFTVDDAHAACVVLGNVDSIDSAIGQEMTAAFHDFLETLGLPRLDMPYTGCVAEMFADDELRWK